MKTTNRLFGLDCLKFICAFFVVCIHSHFQIGDGYVNAAGRIAVAIFFMITGYFYQSCVEKGGQLKQIKKILFLFIFCNILYFVFYSIYYAIFGGLTEKYQSSFTLISLRNFLLFNQSPFVGHLWYLGTILYVLVFVYLFEKKFKRKYLYYLIPVLLCVNLILGNFSQLIFGEAIDKLYSRNSLFMGLPFFLLGDYIRNQKRFNPINCKTAVSGILAVVFMATTMVEYILLDHFGYLGTKELYISSIFCAIFTFTFCVKISDREVNNAFVNAISTAGRKYSMNIYIYHYVILTCIGKLVEGIDFLNTVYTYIKPIIVFIITLIFAIILEAILQKIKTARKKSDSEKVKS